MTKHFLLLCILSIILFSCDKRKNRKQEEIIIKDIQVSMEKLDSIQIEYLGTPSVHDIDPKIYVFENTPSFDLIEEIPLNIPSYNFFEGERSYNPNTLMYLFSSGTIQTLTWVDGYYLVGYFPGYDKQDLAIYSENKSPEESREFGERMRKKYLDRVAIFDSLGNLVSDFAPSTFDPRSIILRDGQLWAMEKPDPDVEKDYFRVFRLELKAN